MLLRQIIQRIQTWAQRLWRLPRVLSPTSNHPVTSKHRQPDTSQFPTNNSQDAHLSAEPSKRRPVEVIQGQPDFENGTGNLEIPKNQNNLSNKTSPPSCDGLEEAPSSLPSEPLKETEPISANVSNENPDSTMVKGKKKNFEPKTPREIGPRRTRTNPNTGSKPRSPPTSRPELICRKPPGSLLWELLLSADDECKIKEMQYNGKSLDMVNGECRITSFRNLLTIVFKNGEQDEIKLFEDTPLIFKLRNNRTYDGRKVCGISNGYFVVIAPKGWERTGHIFCDKQGCMDTNFEAHFFYRDGNSSAKNIGGFRECEVASTTTGFKLAGRRVFDNSTNGELFVGAVPKLQYLQNISWVRVGEEKENGWKGESFIPTERTLEEIINGRQGRFFIRVYDDTELQDSGEFRYLCNLKEISINCGSYSDHTILIPSSTGHPPTKVCFIGVDRATVRPISPLKLMHAEAQKNELIVKPLQSEDDLSCVLESNTGEVDVELKLPRIWWQMKQDGSKTDEWRDTPLTMTRQEFRKHALANATMQLLLPPPIKKIRVGFDDELERVYSRIKDNINSSIPIRLTDFVDYSQIVRQLNEGTSLNIKFDTVILTLILVSADAVPAISSFTCEPETVSAGEQTTLKWATLNAKTCGIVINPKVGKVASSGNFEIALMKTTSYTLRLMSSDSDMDDVIQTITVTVVSLPQPNEKPIARVRRAIGGEKNGKGFSYGELQVAGLGTADAQRQSMPIDKRRQSIHRANVDTIMRFIND